MNNKILRWNFIFQYGYVLTNMFNAVILLPLYLKHIDATVLGLWLATGSILSWMTLADPGVGDVLQQQIAELRGKKQVQEIGRTVGSGFVASAGILLVSVAVGYGFFFLLEAILDKNISSYADLQQALVITVVATGLSLVSFSLSGMNQGMHNSAQVAICSLLANVLFLVVNILLLYLGYGVVSIALSNLVRAGFITLYNGVSLLHVLGREKLAVRFEFSHFRGFIRIFSFTSASRIITGLSASIDMIILARFIPPALITIFEINKRPIKLTQSLVGRHSVALMPLVSHGKGLNDKAGIIGLINRQFRLYSYAALFISLLFCIVYRDLITAWTGIGQYAGDVIMYLLVAEFFFGLIGYFMSNMGYALGDIKRNSQVNILRGLLKIGLIVVFARAYGIVGALAVSLGVTLVADFFYFSYRLHRLGYLQAALLRGIGRLWALIIPLALLIGWGCRLLVEVGIPEQMYISKVLVGAGLFGTCFLLLVFGLDRGVRSTARVLSHKYIVLPIARLRRA